MKCTFTLICLTISIIFTVNHAEAQSSAQAGIGAGIVNPSSMESESTTELMQVSLGHSHGYVRKRLAPELTAPMSFTLTGTPLLAYGVIIPSSITVSRGDVPIRFRTSAYQASRHGVLSEQGKDSLLVLSSPATDTRDSFHNESSDGTLPIMVVYN